MANLKSFLNNTSAVVAKLEYGGEPRPYLGMSGIGGHCERALWYGFHWVNPKKHDSRKERIFNAGHMFEPMIVKQLKDAGIEVYKILEDTEENRLKNEGKFEVRKDGLKIEHFGMPDEEQEEYIGFAGHAKGHSDGRVIGVIEAPEIEHTSEFKTMKEASFKELCKVGIKKAHPVYYSQAQRYMRSNGTKWTLFVVVNKNTSHLYFERVPLVEKEAHDLLRKEQMIVMADIVPYSDYAKDYYKCTYCGAREICHGETEPAKNCRTCEYCDIEDEGKWSCSWKDRKFLSTEEQRVGCKHYKKGWDL